MRLLLLQLCLCLIANPALGAETSIVEHCDLGAASTKSLPAPKPEVCRDLCDKDAQCQGFTFISGWNRCFFKAKTKPRATVKMYSGMVETKDDKRAVTEEGYQKDNNGKDWKKLVLNTPEECRAACLKEEPCIGFTLIEGYRTCWLKNTSGRLREKTFYCGTKN